MFIGSYEWFTTALEAPAIWENAEDTAGEGMVPVIHGIMMALIIELLAAISVGLDGTNATECVGLEAEDVISIICFIDDISSVVDAAVRQIPS